MARRALMHRARACGCASVDFDLLEYTLALPWAAGDVGWVDFKLADIRGTRATTIQQLADELLGRSEG